LLESLQASSTNSYYPFCSSRSNGYTGSIVQQGHKVQQEQPKNQGNMASDVGEDGRGLFNTKHDARSVYSYNGSSKTDGDKLDASENSHCDDPHEHEVKSITLGTEASVSGKNTDDSESTGNQDSPQALVRQENRVVKILRNVIFVALSFAAVGTVSLVYIFARSSERETFSNEYEAISRFVIDALVDDLGRFVWAGQTVSSAVTMAMTAYNVTPRNLAIPRVQWNELTAGLRAATGSKFLSWSPFIRNDIERGEFESFVSELEEKGYFKGGGEHPVCFVCGSADLGVVVPEDEFVSATQGNTWLSC
jgi:hypothetical protein